MSYCVQCVVCIAVLSVAVLSVCMCCCVSFAHLIAAFCCAQEKTAGSTGQAIVNIMKKLGFRGVFTGIGPRTVMVTSIIAGQFFIYDSVKMLLGVHA